MADERKKVVVSDELHAALKRDAAAVGARSISAYIESRLYGVLSESGGGESRPAGRRAASRSDGLQSAAPPMSVGNDVSGFESRREAAGVAPGPDYSSVPILTPEVFAATPGAADFDFSERPGITPPRCCGSITEWHKATCTK